ncbi:MAG TPA: hypothetical protein VFZ29_11835 [Solirubrobacterales bacterium]
MAGTASAAPAGQSYAYKADIGSGEFGTIDPVLNSVATSQDRVFILDQFNSNGEGGFEVLGSDGTSITKVVGSDLPWAIAVTPDGSAVYTLGAGTFGNAPIKYTSDGAPTPTYTQDATWAPDLPGGRTGIAVDPVTGDVLIAAGGPIYRVDSSTGALLSTIDGSTTDTGALHARYLAVAPNQDIYALEADGGLEHMGADGSWKGRLNIPVPTGVSTGIGIAVNPQNGDVAVDLSPGFVTKNDRVIRIFTPANDLKEDIRVPPDAADGNAGLAFSSDGSKLYVGLTNGTAHVFNQGTKPGLDGPTVSQLTPFSFNLTDMVGTGGETTKARFEYCLASDPCGSYLTSEGSSPWHALPDHEGLANPSEEDEIADDLDDLDGLKPLTDYLVRSYAINEVSGVENISSPVAVSTPLSPPAVETGGALADLTTATLNGTINAWGGQTTFHFEYGLTTAYESRVPVLVEGVAGSLQTPRVFSRAVSGLQPGTTYHYRLVATNAAGTTAGADRTFTTLGVDQVAPGRGYEQVTSPDKNGLVPINNYGFQAAPSGGAIEYTASAPSADSESAAQVSRYIARRGSTDWIGQQPLDPPQLPSVSILNSVTHAVSDDFQHSVSVSPVALTPDAVEGAANIYVTDLETGAYHLIGTATQPGAWVGLAGTKQANWYIGGAPDFSWVVLISRFPLLPDAPQTAMYKWTETSGLSIVSLLPGDDVPTGNTWQQSAEERTNRLVSDDGDTVAFSLVSGETGVYRRSGGETVAISESQATGGPAGLQPGVALGMSRDGRFVFFVSDSQLTDDATDRSGVTATNLYRYDASSDQLEFLGIEGGNGDGASDLYAISDDGDTVYFNGSQDFAGGLYIWRGGQLDTVSPQVVFPQEAGLVHASPNGRYLSYSRGGAVYFYDADAGEATCISCPLNGLAAGAQFPNPERNISNRLPQIVTDDGHAYFGTAQALLTADRNSVNDVYEYYEGRLTLISPGNDEFPALLVDISPDGRDVFFTTAQGLVGQDTDMGYDVYDARVGGGFAAQNPPPSPPPCQGDFCQGEPPPTPVILAPGSAQSGDSGKTKQVQKHCAKNKRKVRRNGKTVCVKKRNAKHNRGAGR